MKHILTTLAAAGTMMMVAGTSQAAVTASFGTATAINSNDDIINPGNVIRAVNLGGPATNVTVGSNVINFDPTGVNLNGGAAFSNDQFFVDDNTAAGVVTGGNGIDINQASDDTEFHLVLDSFIDNKNFYFEFTGLSAGTYYLQAFHSDDRGSSDRNGVSFDIMTNPGGGFDELLIDSFSYSSTTATFQSEYVVATIELTGSSDSFAFQRTGRNWNALVLTQVPEPGSLALLGLGGLCLLRRRRD